MNDTTKYEILQAIGELSVEFPEWRLGQMIANLAVLARGATPEAIWDVEDEELLATIREQVEQHRGRVKTLAESHLSGST